MHEEEARLIVEHMVMQRRHLYAGAAPTAALITNHSSGTWLFPSYQGNG
jgi:hypothetical protein